MTTSNYPLTLVGHNEGNYPNSPPTYARIGKASYENPVYRELGGIPLEAIPPQLNGSRQAAPTNNNPLPASPHSISRPSSSNMPQNTRLKSPAVRPAKTFFLNVIGAEANSREHPSDVLPVAGDMAQAKDLLLNLTKTDQVVYLAGYHFYTRTG